ncbi:MAG: right-handed parallel beta-helix repeat-containing protein, partial [bacterium]
PEAQGSPGYQLSRALPADQVYLVKDVPSNGLAGRYLIEVDVQDPRMYVRSDATPGGDGLSWQGAMNTIGAALEVIAGMTGEMWVAGGRYHESVYMWGSVGLYGGFDGTEKTLDERDWVANETIIDARGCANRFWGNATAGVGISDSAGAIDGFTVTGASKNGITCSWDSSPTLTNCTITGNTGGGVYCSGSSPTLTHCTITGNTGCGVSCGGPSSTLTNCTITGNAGGGVYCGSGSARLVNCILWNDGVEIRNDGGATITVSYSDIRGGWPGTGNIEAEPLFIRPWDGESADLRLMPTSPCIDAGNPHPFYNDTCRPPGLGTERCDMGTYGGPGNSGPPECERSDQWMAPCVVYVRADAAQGGHGLSWEDALSSIGVALQIVGGTSEIWVAAGMYHETVRIEAGIAIYGGFAGVEETREERNWVANETTIDASGLKATAVTGSGGAILDGFTVTGGENSGVTCSGRSSCPTLTNCTIAGNMAEYGGGVYCSGYSSPTLINCTITANTAFEGGGVYCYESSPTVANCMIAGNTGGSGGGVFCMASSPTLTNCTITGNTADLSGGGVCCRVRSSITMRNCTFSDNCAPNGNALACDLYNSIYPSTVEMLSCILWDGGDEIWNNDDSTITISYSDICGGWPGEGNIDTDPLFVHPWDGENADLHLMQSSPCVDAANPDPSYNDGCLPPGLGTERCDMGAYGGPRNCGWAVPEELVGVLEWMMH